MQTLEWLRIWGSQIRAPFLVLSVLLVSIGGAQALQDGVFNGWRFVLTLAGVALAHMAVNMYNELSDHQTGIDLNTRPTAFSGGSGTLQAGNLTTATVLKVSVVVLFTAFGIGLYLTMVSGWPLIIPILLGGLAAVSYTPYLTSIMLGELAAGLCLGTLVVLGTYYAQAAHLSSTVIWLSIPPGMLTFLLLLLNEFPDVQADKAGGRRHIVIMLGARKAAVLYAGVMAMTYALFVVGVVVDQFPSTVLLTFLTLPLAIKAARIALSHGGKPEELPPALGANVAMVLLNDFLMAAAILIHGVYAAGWLRH